MRLRLAKVDESQFLISLKKGVWGSKATRFSDWQKGDQLLFIVDKSFAGIAEVNGEPYFSNKHVWEEGLFPYRIPLKFIHASIPQNRVILKKKVRDVLTSVWGPNYHKGILSQLLLNDSQAETIIGEIRSSQNDLAEIQSDIRELTVRSKPLKRSAVKDEKKSGGEKKINSTDVTACDTIGTEEEVSAHIYVQGMLVQLGKVIGCSVWISPLYRNRHYMGKPLGDGCLESLSNLHMNEDVTNLISSIDVVWLRHNVPLCAFEVETGSLMCSGLLRVSDLITVVPAMNVELFFVAPGDMREDLRKAISHPTFQNIGLSEVCRFIPIEGMEGLLSKIDGLDGHVKTDILDTIAVELEEEYPGNLDV